MKAGIIRCTMTEDLCPGTTDFKMAATGKGAFGETGPVEIIGFVSCGGCPGKKVMSRVKILVDRGTDILFFASCMKKGTPIGFPCPHFDTITKVVNKHYGDKIKIADWTH